MNINFTVPWENNLQKSDLVICTKPDASGNSTLYANKSILAGSSRYFNKRIFGNEEMEANSDVELVEVTNTQFGNYVVEVKAEYKIFMEILRILHEDQANYQPAEPYECDFLVKLCRVAEKYSIYNLKEFFLQQIETKNVQCQYLIFGVLKMTEKKRDCLRKLDTDGLYQILNPSTAPHQHSFVKNDSFSTEDVKGMLAIVGDSNLGLSKCPSCAEPNQGQLFGKHKVFIRCSRCNEPYLSS